MTIQECIALLDVISDIQTAEAHRLRRRVLLTLLDLIPSPEPQDTTMTFTSPGNTIVGYEGGGIVVGKK